MKKPGDQRGPSTADDVPHGQMKAVSDSARSEPRTGGRIAPTEADTPTQLGTDRTEVGDGRSSSRRPPHVQDHEKDIDVQGTPPGEPAPVLPANAAGRDRVTVDEQDELIDDESMYDRRPERDKNRPPSKRSGQ